MSTTAPSLVALTYGQSFGMCVGYCNRVIRIDGRSVDLDASTHSVNGPVITNRAVLTPEGVNALSAATASLHISLGSQRIGCPDCADGGATSIAIPGPDGVHEVVYEYGSAPPLFRDIDGVADGLLAGLVRCESSALAIVDDVCEPIDSR